MPKESIILSGGDRNSETEKPAELSENEKIFHELAEYIFEEIGKYIGFKSVDEIKRNLAGTIRRSLKKDKSITLDELLRNTFKTKKADVSALKKNLEQLVEKINEIINEHNLNSILSYVGGFGDNIVDQSSEEKKPKEPEIN